MLIAMSVMSGQMDKLRARWRLEGLIRSWPLTEPLGKVGFRLLPGDPEELGPAFTDASGFGGLMVVMDAGSGREVWRSDWGNYLASPSGFCFAGDRMYCADLEGSNIFEIDLAEQPGRLLRRISHPALNDIHTLARTRRGLLVASTGVDMVIELDGDGNSLYQWWAAEYGFATSPYGQIRLPQPDLEHRDQYYPTSIHTTHLNAATYRDSEETHLLVLLWQQGMLLEIDTTRPTGQQTPRVVLEGLTHPHTIRPLACGGWLICNTQGAELVILDSDLRVERRIPSLTGWIQDALPLGEDRWLVADVDAHRLVVHDGQGRQLAEMLYDQGWRPFGLQAVPGCLEDVFLRPGQTRPQLAWPSKQFR